MMGRNLKYFLLYGFGLSTLFIFLFLYHSRLYTSNLLSGWYTFGLLKYYLGEYASAIILPLIFFNLVFLSSSRINEGGWKTTGVYMAFMISLFTEMFGAGLILYLTSPFIQYTILTPDYATYPFTIAVRVISFYLILVGILMIIIGWKTIYSSKKLVTSGIYKYVRHPQYTGFSFICIGWLGYFPSIIPLIILPGLLIVYFRQSRFEDKMLEKKYGKEYLRYMQSTPSFFPFVIKRKDTV